MKKLIKLDHITKIEGHAKLNIKIDNGKIKHARIDVVEGARFFEAMLKGRRWDEVSVLASRICGVCSPIHAITSLMAVEDAFKVEITAQTKMLRDLLAFGGVIQSHVMHLFFLALPDYYGYSSAIDLADKHGEKLKLALRLKKLGNEMVTFIGGRDVHPFTSIVGGFSKLPEKEKLDKLLKDLIDARQDVLDTVKLFTNLKYPQFERKTEYFALEYKTYGFLKGKISCVGNLCVPPFNYNQHFKEYFQQHSTAEFVVAEGKGYMVGALSRLNLNHNLLSKEIRDLVPFKLPSHSPFMNNVAQAIELVYAVERCIEILKDINLRKEPLPEIKVKASRGVAVTEAPRGMLFHDYTFNKSGIITKVNITTPTSQNLRNIEDDIKAFLPGILNLPKQKILLELEKLIRAYDPCISCSTHFLEVEGL